MLIAEERAGALATCFVAGYAGISLLVLGAGVALEHLSAPVTLLGFGLAVALGLAVPGATAGAWTGRDQVDTRRAFATDVDGSSTWSRSSRSPGWPA